MLPSPLRVGRTVAVLAATLAVVATALPSAVADDTGSDSLVKPPRPAPEPRVSRTDDRAAGLVVTYATPQARTRRAAAVHQVARAATDDAVTSVPVAADTSAVRFDAPVPLAEAQDAAEEVAALPGVVSVVPDRYRTISAVPPVRPNDALFSHQWALWDTRTGTPVDGDGNAVGPPMPDGGYGTHAPALWRATVGSPSVVVAVVDTGSTPHPDLDAGTVAGYDMISDSSVARDSNGRDVNPTDVGDWSPNGLCQGETYPSSWHGTHVAGIVAARADNRVGVVGNAPGVKIQHVRALGACGGVDSDVLAAITWASGGTVPGLPANPTPAKVINLSLGGPSDVCPASYVDVIAAARARGSVVVAAAGNEDDDADLVVPASCPGVVSVTGTDEWGQRASFANTGSTVDLAAPSGDFADGYRAVLSTVNSGETTAEEPAYAEYAGTSMAAPAVSAAAALLLSVNARQSPAQVEAGLRNATRRFPSYPPGDGPDFNCTDLDCGRGMLDLSFVQAPIGAPRIAGTARVGNVVHPTGWGWTGSTTVGFRWLRDGVAIAGATAPAYTVQPADVGRRLSVRMTPEHATAPVVGVVRTSASTGPVPRMGSRITARSSKTRARYGRSRIRLTAKVSVSPGSPAGTVVFRDGSKVLKKVKVRNGKATYTLGKRRLKPGKHRLSATFVPSSGRYERSRTGPRALLIRVVR